MKKKKMLTKALCLLDSLITWPKSRICHFLKYIWKWNWCVSAQLYGEFVMVCVAAGSTVLKFHNAMLLFCSILHQTATFHALLISAKPFGKSCSVTTEQCSGMRTMTKMRQQLCLLVRNCWKQNFWYLEITLLVLKLLIYVLVSLWSWLNGFRIFAESMQ